MAAAIAGNLDGYIVCDLMRASTDTLLPSIPGIQGGHVSGSVEACCKAVKTGDRGPNGTQISDDGGRL